MIKECLKRAGKLGWNVKHKEDYSTITFSKISLEGQDFSFEIEYEEGEGREDIDLLLGKLQEYCEGFDISYEAYLWLDETGHGTNGAPYNMKDVYEDMEWCLDEVDELLNDLADYKIGLEQ